MLIPYSSIACLATLVVGTVANFDRTSPDVVIRQTPNSQSPLQKNVRIAKVEVECAFPSSIRY
jgi:hypothetical protein